MSRPTMQERELAYECIRRKGRATVAEVSAELGWDSAKTRGVLMMLSNRKRILKAGMTERGTTRASNRASPRIIWKVNE